MLREFSYFLTLSNKLVVLECGFSISHAGEIKRSCVEK